MFIVQNMMRLQESAQMEMIALTFIGQQAIQKESIISDITRLEHAFMKQMPGVTVQRMEFTVPLLMVHMTLDHQCMI